MELEKLYSIKKELQDMDLSTVEVDERINKILNAINTAPKVSEYVNNFKNSWRKMNSLTSNSIGNDIIVWTEFPSGGEIRKVRINYLYTYCKMKAVNFLNNGCQQNCIAWKPLSEVNNVNINSSSFDESPYLSIEQRNVWRNITILSGNNHILLV